MKKYLMIFTLLLCTFVGANAQPCDCCQCDDDCYPSDGYELEDCEPQWCEERGLYASLFGGANWLHFNSRHHSKATFDVGFAGAVAIGFRFNSSFRAEVEFSYRYNELDRARCFGQSLHIKGHTDSITFMANGYYDINLNRCFNLDTCFTPYVGLGIGYAHLWSCFSHHYFKVRGSDNGLAGQAIVGVSTRIWTRTDLGVEYRYLLARSNCYEQSVGLSLRYGF